MSVAVKLQTLRYELEIIKGPHIGQKYTFDNPSVTIGRETNNQIPLPQDLRVSRLHAEIRNTDGQIFFVNRSQKNYVLVDGSRVEFQQLKNNSTITIGETEIKIKFLENNAAVAVPPASAQNPLRPLGIDGRAGLAVQKNFPGSMMPPGGMVAQSEVSPKVLQFQKQQPSARYPSQNKSQFLRNLLIVLVIGLAVYFLFLDSPQKKKKNSPIRGGDIIEREMQDSQEKIEVLEAKIKVQNSLTNKRAEENFIKGFRDYQKGQYLRAKEYFRITLNLNSQHIEARKYYEQSIIKYKKQMEFNFIEGLKNKDRKNYRLCKSFFTQVLVLAQGDRTGYEKYDEAEKYLRECNLGLEGGF